MGLTENTIKVVLFLRNQRLLPDRAEVVELGAQQLSNNFLRDRSGLDALGKPFGIDHPWPGLPSEPEPYAGTHVEPQSPDAPAARGFWEWLGCNYAAIDIDDTPGSLPLDLNYDD